MFDHPHTFSGCRPFRPQSFRTCPLRPRAFRPPFKLAFASVASGLIALTPAFSLIFAIEERRFGLRSKFAELRLGGGHPSGSGGGVRGNWYARALLPPWPIDWAECGGVGA